MPRTSANARAVAREVIRKTQAGEKVTLAPIIRAQGYSESVSKNPERVTDRDSYKEEMASYVQLLEKERMRVIQAMGNKNLNQEQYRTLSDANAKLTHDVQLLTGGKTENIGMEQDRQTLKAVVAAIQIEE